MSKPDGLSQKHAKIVSRLVILTLMVFAFGFALVPLYDVFCDVTGINGKTSPTTALAQDCTAELSEGREITVRFITALNQSAREGELDFGTLVHENKVIVNPCNVYEVSYFMENLSEEYANVQAIPSVSPGQAAKYFHKPVCFCWDSQHLDAGERQEWPVHFFIDPALPEHLNTITINYTLFKTGRDKPKTTEEI